MTGDVTEKVCNGVEKRIHKFAAQLAFISTNIMCSSRCLKPTIFFFTSAKYISQVDERRICFNNSSSLYYCIANGCMRHCRLCFLVLLLPRFSSLLVFSLSYSLFLSNTKLSLQGEAITFDSKANCSKFLHKRTKNLIQ